MTGLWRWLGGVEKPGGYYVTNHWFMAKMGCLVIILALEVMPMVTLIRWRMALGLGVEVPALPVPSRARAVSVIGAVQALLVVAMVFFVVLMARGYRVMAR